MTPGDRLLGRQILLSRLGGLRAAGHLPAERARGGSAESPLHISLTGTAELLTPFSDSLLTLRWPQVV